MTVAVYTCYIPRVFVLNWLKSFWKGLNTPMPVACQPKIEPPRRIPQIAACYGETFNLFNMTPRSEAVFKSACREAERLHHNFIGTEHVLLGIIRFGQGVAVNVLTKMGLDLEGLRREIEKRVLPPAETMPDHIPFTPRVKKVLNLAAKEAKALDRSYVGTEHILLGLLAEGDGIGARALISLGVDLDDMRRHVRSETGS